jgi:hypothetical protein
MPHTSIYSKQDHNFTEHGCPTFPSTVNRGITLQNMDESYVPVYCRWKCWASMFCKDMILFTVDGNVGHPCSVKL